MKQGTYVFTATPKAFIDMCNENHIMFSDMGKCSAMYGDYSVYCAMISKKGYDVLKDTKCNIIEAYQIKKNGEQIKLK